MIIFLLIVIWILMGFLYITHKSLSSIYSVNKKNTWKENLFCFPAMMVIKIIKKF